MLRSEDVILVTRGGRPAGFFVPWDPPDPPDDFRREVFLRLADEIAAQREAAGVTEEDVLGDFTAARHRREER